MTTPLIEDEEFRELFAAESEEHLSNIEQGLLELETDPENSDLLHAIFRSAHSLKGASRVLGLQDIETVSHLLEEKLGKAHKNEIKLDEDLTDRLYRGLDALKGLCKQALGEEVLGIDIVQVAEDLKGEKIKSIIKDNAMSEIVPMDKPLVKETKQVTPPIEPIESIEPVSSKKTDAAPKPAVVEKVPDRKVAENQMGTIRVPADKLDSLLSMAGELIISKIRFEKRIEDITSLADGWDHLKIKILDSIDIQDSEDKASLSALVESFSNEILSLRTGMLSYRSFHEGVVQDLDHAVRGLRLLPLGTLFQQLKRPIRDLSRELGKDIDLILEGEDVTADKRIIESMKDPLIHMLRNSIDHGIESPEERKSAGKAERGRIKLSAARTSGNILLKFSDDGKGLNQGKIRNKALQTGLLSTERAHALSDEQIYELIFHPGFSTKQNVSNVSGRGVGMDVVRQNISELKGHIKTESLEGQGTSFIMSFPVSLATAKVFLIKVAGSTLAIPVDNIQRSLWVKKDSIKRVAGKNLLDYDGETIPIARLRHLLRFPDYEQEKRKKFPCLVVKDGSSAMALIVDELIDETDIVIKNQTDLLRKVRGIAGYTILESGQPANVVQVQDLFKDFLSGNFARSTEKTNEDGKTTEADMDENRVPEILLAEDSLLTRLQQKRMLESAGFKVTEAVDGLKAWDLLHQKDYDLLVSDVEMPNMTGLELTSKVKSDEKLKGLPVVLVTTLGSDEDKKRGLDAGADAYLPKGNLAYDTLIESIRRLL